MNTAHKKFKSTGFTIKVNPDSEDSLGKCISEVFRHNLDYDFMIDFKQFGKVVKRIDGRRVSDDSIKEVAQFAGLSSSRKIFVYLDNFFKNSGLHSGAFVGASVMLEDIDGSTTVGA